MKIMSWMFELEKEGNSVIARCVSESNFRSFTLASDGMIDCTGLCLFEQALLDKHFEWMRRFNIINNDIPDFGEDDYCKYINFSEIENIKVSTFHNKFGGEIWTRAYVRSVFNHIDGTTVLPIIVNGVFNWSALAVFKQCLGEFSRMPEVLKWTYATEETVLGKVIEKGFQNVSGSFTATVQVSDEALKKILGEEILGKVKENKMGPNLEKVHSISIEALDDGKTVKATAYGRNAINRPYIIAETTAKCGPNDIFDFNIGAKLVLDRLYEGYDMTPKPKRKPYNGLIYIHEYPGVMLKARALYKVKNGVIEGAVTHWSNQSEPYIFEDMNDFDLGHAIKNRFCIPRSMILTAHFVRNDQTKA